VLQIEKLLEDGVLVVGDEAYWVDSEIKNFQLFQFDQQQRRLLQIAEVVICEIQAFQTWERKRNLF